MSTQVRLGTAMFAEKKDVMIAVLGASVALSGLLLVFCGFLFAQAAVLPSATTPDRIIEKFKRAARLGMIPFLSSLAVAGLSFAWMLTPNPYLFGFTEVAFCIILLGTGIYGAAAILHLL
jgi:hypothetical protein